MSCTVEKEVKTLTETAMSTDFQDGKNGLLRTETGNAVGEVVEASSQKEYI